MCFCISKYYLHTTFLSVKSLQPAERSMAWQSFVSSVAIIVYFWPYKGLLYTSYMCLITAWTKSVVLVLPPMSIVRYCNVKKSNEVKIILFWWINSTKESVITYKLNQQHQIVTYCSTSKIIELLPILCSFSLEVWDKNEYLEGKYRKKVTCVDLPNLTKQES